MRTPFWVFFLYPIFFQKFILQWLCKIQQRGACIMSPSIVFWLEIILIHQFTTLQNPADTGIIITNLFIGKRKICFNRKMFSMFGRTSPTTGLCRCKIIHDRINPCITNQIQIRIFINDGYQVLFSATYDSQEERKDKILYLYSRQVRRA